MAFPGQKLCAKIEHFSSEQFELREPIHQNFTANQIQCLNTRSPFIESRYTAVAQNLLHAPFFDVAVPAKHLHT